MAVEAVDGHYGERQVLSDVSFVAPTGQVTVLVGPSGCGKTTLLRLISGIVRPSAGRIRLGGTDVAGPGLHVAPERRRIGLMFQDYALFPHLTAAENVAFGLHDRPRTVRRERVAEALERVALGHLADRRPGQLSGGEQQRLALARALAPSPRALLLDEPFSNLDRRLREDVRAGTLAILKEAGVTAIVVTHDPEEALSIGDHLVLLEGGRVIQAGSAAEVYARPASLAAARALSDVNVLPGRFANGGLQTSLGLSPAGRAGQDGHPGVAVYRPEQLRAATSGDGLPGRIEALTFRGASTLLSVTTGAGEGALRVAVQGARFSVGQSVVVSATEPAAMVLDGIDAAAFEPCGASSEPRSLEMI